MSDTRWVEIDDDISAAERHFSFAVDLYEDRGFDAEGLEGYRANMGFMHAMQAGHTSLEKALTRILDLLGEDKPTGEFWDRDLIKRVSRDLESRPAILGGELARAANETRSFRNLATRDYDNFAVERAEPAVSSARTLFTGLSDAIAALRAIVDAPEAGGGGNKPPEVA